MHSTTPSLRGKPHPVRLTTTQIKYSLCHRPRQFLYQSTHQHPFITRGSSLSGHTSIYMVKHQICTRVDHTVVRHYIHSLCLPACTSLTREVFVIQSVRGGGQYSQSGYAFRKTSLSLETFILTPNTGSCDLAVQNFMLA